MDNFKLFAPEDIDATLTRVVTHGRHTYLLFPYIDAIGMTPKFKSVGVVISGPTATIHDLAALSESAKHTAERAEWFISFNTPWLVSLEEAGNIRQRASSPKPRRK